MLLMVTPLALGCSSAGESQQASSATPAPASATPDTGAADAPPACRAAPQGSESVALATSAADACWTHDFVASLAPNAVVCVGEPSHGIRESDVARVALITEILAHQDAVQLVLEVDDATATELSDYVRTGSNEALARGLEPALGTLASSVSTLDELRALHDLVATSNKAITLRGMDVDIVNTSSVRQLAALMDRVAPALAKDVRALPAADTIKHAEAGLAAVNALHEQFEAVKKDLAAADYELGSARLLSLATGYQFAGYYTQNDFKTGNATVREPFMADRLRELAEVTRGVTVVSAHNGHCARAEVAQGTKPADRLPAMGEIASRGLGSRYITVGILAGGGEELYPDGSTVKIVPVPLAESVAKHTDAEVALLPDRGNVLDGVDLDAPTRTVYSTVAPSTQWNRLLWLRTASKTRKLARADIPK